MSVRMADIYSKEARSSVMRRIPGTGNRTTEIRLIEIFRKLGIKGWRRNQKLAGRPDFLFRRERLAVFVDGCFWHCCPHHGTLPVSRRQFWARKLEANKLRDRFVNSSLRSQGWYVFRIWEHELRKVNRSSLVRRLKRRIQF